MNKKYWLMGGIIGAVVALIIVFIFQNVDFVGTGADNLFIVLLLFVPILLMAGLPFMALYPICASVWFIIGSIFGWLYGKIKNR